MSKILAAVIVAAFATTGAYAQTKPAAPASAASAAKKDAAKKPEAKKEEPKK